MVIEIIGGTRAAQRLSARFEHRLFTTDAALHQRIAWRHRRGFVLHSVVEQRASFVDTRRGRLSVRNQRVDITGAKRLLSARL